MQWVAELYAFECGDITTLCSSVVSLHGKRAQTGNITALKSQHYQTCSCSTCPYPTRSFVRPFVRCMQPKPVGPNCAPFRRCSRNPIHEPTANCDSSNIQFLLLDAGDLQTPFNARRHTCPPPRFES